MAQHKDKASLAKEFGITTAIFTDWLTRTVAEFNLREGARIQQHRSITEADVIKAVMGTGGKDYYTGESLKWERIPDYYKSQKLGKDISERRLFWQVPTVDREDPFGPSPAIRLCSRKVAAIKADVNPRELVKLAIQVKDHLELGLK